MKGELLCFAKHVSDVGSKRHGTKGNVEKKKKYYPINIKKEMIENIKVC